MLNRVYALLALSILAFSSAGAQVLEGGYLYKVSTVRAAPGSLSGLLDWLAVLEDSTYFADAGEMAPFVMRHSQGDQWDLMIITPMKSWTDYYSKANTRRRDKSAASHSALISESDAMIAFDADHFAYGPPLPALKAAYDDNLFFHIEMFDAAPGKTAELIKQRQMENDYLKATGQTANMIFRRAAGSDVDVFTIGFHKSLEAFAAPADATDEEKEAAAIAAGFKDRSDISFYLRSLISGHHDTLAVKVE